MSEFGFALLAIGSLFAFITVAFLSNYWWHKEYDARELKEIDAAIFEKQLREPIKTYKQIEAEKLENKYRWMEWDKTGQKLKKMEGLHVDKIG